MLERFNMLDPVETPLFDLLKKAGCDEVELNIHGLFLSTGELNLAHQISVSIENPGGMSLLDLGDHGAFIPVNTVDTATKINLLHVWISDLLNKRIPVVQKTLSQIIAYYDETEVLLPTDKPFEDEQLVGELRVIVDHLSLPVLAKLVEMIRSEWDCSESVGSIRRRYDFVGSKLHAPINDVFHLFGECGSPRLLPDGMIAELESQTSKAKSLNHRWKESDEELTNAISLGKLAAELFSETRIFSGEEILGVIKRYPDLRFSEGYTLSEHRSHYEQMFVDALKETEWILEHLTNLIEVNTMAGAFEVGSEDWNNVFGMFRPISTDNARSGKLPRLLTLGDIVNLVR